MHRYRFSTADRGSCSVRENTVEGGDPPPRSTEAERAGACRVRCDHAADGTKHSAGWVDRKSKALLTRPTVDLSPDGARRNKNSPGRFVDDTYFVETAEVDDYPGPHSAAGHPTARAPRDERRSRAIRPDGESDNVVGVTRHCHCRGDLPGNAGSFGVHRSRRKIFAEYAAEFARRQAEKSLAPRSSAYRAAPAAAIESSPTFASLPRVPRDHLEPFSP